MLQRLGPKTKDPKEENSHGANSFTPTGGMPARLPVASANEPGHVPWG